MSTKSDVNGGISITNSLDNALPVTFKLAGTTPYVSKTSSLSIRSRDVRHIHESSIERLTLSLSHSSGIGL